MNIQSSSELAQHHEFPETLRKIEALRTEVLTGIDQHFVFSPEEPGRGRDIHENAYAMASDENGEEAIVLFKSSYAVPLNTSVLGKDYVRKAERVSAEAVIKYKVNIIEPEHWKRVLLRKKFVPAILEPTDEILDVALFLNINQPGGSPNNWWHSFSWNQSERPKKQIKDLKEIQEVLELVEKFRQSK